MTGHCDTLRPQQQTGRGHKVKTSEEQILVICEDEDHVGMHMARRVVRSGYDECTAEDERGHARPRQRKDKRDAARRKDKLLCGRRTSPSRRARTQAQLVGLFTPPAAHPNYNGTNNSLCTLAHSARAVHSRCRWHAAAAIRMALRAALAILARALAVFLAAPLAAVGPCLPLIPARVAVPRLYQPRDMCVSVRKSRLGRHHLPARIATTLAILRCMVRAEAFAAPKRLRMLMRARAGQAAPLTRSHPPLAPLAMVVAE